MINDYQEASLNIMDELRRYCTENSLKSLVIGVSGGIDSAVCCALAKPVCDELEIPLIGRYIGITTNKQDELERAIAIGEAYCHDFGVVDLGKEYKALHSGLEGDKNNKIANGNVKARMRMIYLYDLAGKNGGMVLGTDNMTEYLLSFWTKNGDDFDYNLIHGLWKTEVYGMADNFVLCSDDNKSAAMMACINADATDGLGISKTDLDQILPDWRDRYETTRAGYREVDYLLRTWRDNTHVGVLAKMEESPVIQRHLKFAFKRNIPINVGRDVIFR